jgi:hypothetical protein
MEENGKSSLRRPKLSTKENSAPGRRKKKKNKLGTYLDYNNQFLSPSPL